MTSHPSVGEKETSMIAIQKRKVHYKHVLQSSLRKAAKESRDAKKLQEKVLPARDVNHKLMVAKIKNESLLKDKEILEQQGQIAELKAELKRPIATANYLRKKSGAVSTKANHICESLEMYFVKLYPGKHARTKAKLLLAEFLDGKLLKGEVKSAVYDFVCSRISYLFRPWKIVKAGDVSPIGAFRTSTSQALHDVIDEFKEGLFPSPSSVDRARKLLDNYAIEKIGYERKETKYGEVYFLHFERAFRLLLKACNLHQLATTSSVKVSFSVDGADLLHDRMHVSCGVKITDERGIHPIMKQPL